MPDPVFSPFCSLPYWKNNNRYYLLRLLCAKHCVKYYRGNISIPQNNNPKRQALCLFYKRRNRRERWWNWFKVVKLGRAIAGILPCIIWNQGQLAGSAHWVGTIGSAPTVRTERRSEAPFQVVQTLLQGDDQEAREACAKLDMATLHLTSK